MNRIADFCEDCGKKNEQKFLYCTQCGKKLEVPTSRQMKKTKIYEKEWFLGITLIILIIGLVLIIKLASTNNKVENEEKNEYAVNETFKFNNLEITIGKEYTFTTIDNKYSDYYKKDVIKIPINIKNIKDERHSLNMFYYSVFGINGTEIENVGTYFEDNIEMAGDLKTGASYTKYLYVIYDGDGIYSIEFSNYFEKKTVEFQIKK
jgi:hypothetical protein